MVQDNRNQCGVVSGESGGGKTEASNMVVQQFRKFGVEEWQSTFIDVVDFYSQLASHDTRRNFFLLAV